MNELIKLLEDGNLMSRLENAMSLLNEKLGNIDFGIEKFDTFNTSDFKDMGPNYELRVKSFNEKINEDNINVELEDDKFITVSVEYSDENTTYNSTTSVTIPCDAIADSLRADLVDGEIVITVDKRKESKKIRVNKN